MGTRAPSKTARKQVRIYKSTQKGPSRKLNPDPLTGRQMTQQFYHQRGAKCIRLISYLLSQESWYVVRSTKKKKKTPQRKADGDIRLLHGAY